MDLWAHLDYNRHSVKNVLIFGITFYELQIFSRKKNEKKNPFNLSNEDPLRFSHSLCVRFHIVMLNLLLYYSNYGDILVWYRFKRIF